MGQSRDLARTPWIFYPPAIAAFPVASVYSANVGLVPVSDITRPLLVSLAVGLAAWLLCATAFRSWSVGAAVGSLFAVLLWAYQPLVDRVGLVGWVTLSLIGVVLIWRSRVILPRVTRPLNIFATLGLGFAFAFSITPIIRNSLLMHGIRPDVTRQESKSASRPDIFYIILDGYGRADQLKRLFGYNNDAFLGSLRGTGFRVYDDSRSNYCQTALSLASSLNFSFIPDLTRGIPPTTSDREPLYALVDDSEASKFFRKLGYRNIAVTTGFPSFNFRTADAVLSKPQTMNLLESTLLARTPVGRSEEVVQSQFTERAEQLKGGFSNLRSLVKRTETPRFVVAHILAPHPPFVMNPDGTPNGRRGAFGYFDGSDYMEFAGKPKDYISGYVDQLKWLNQEVLKFARDLQARPGPRPIVVIQGDHGSKLKLDQNNLAKTDVQECFSNLMAISGPAEVENFVGPTPTPVNTFRAILSTQFGADLPALPDRSFYSEFAMPYQFTEITDRLH